MTDVCLKGLKKSYGKVEVIPSLDLDIRSGEFVVLVGPSGSGKSTLLRMIAGLESVNAGTVSVNGNDVTGRDPGDRDMAMVFQSYALYPHMTVGENMTFALRMRGMDETTIRNRLAEALRMLSLEGLERRKPGQLSGGQRQRVAMGRAIVRQPRVFLFDEPLSNLDAKLRARTRIELREMHEKLGATSIFVTHDQIEAMTMADRIVLLEKGCIQQVGSPREIYQKPHNTFVASFIGSPEINMLQGTLRFETGTAWFERLVLRSHGSEAASLAGVAAGAHTLGIRPEAFDIAREPLEGSVPMVVVAIEYTGSDTFAFGETPMGNLAVKIPADRQAIAETLHAGETLYVTPLTDGWYLFDSSGKRVAGG